MRPRRTSTVHSGQFVAVELAALALVLAALARSPAGWLAGVPAAVALVALGFGRWRGRWLHAWLGTAIRYATRTRTLPAGTGPEALLALLEPGARVTSLDAYGVVVSEYGLCAALELGDPGVLVADAPTAVPAPAQLLPGESGEAPAVQVQLLVCGAPAPALRAGSGIPATNYRQLTEGRGIADRRAYLAVRVLRDGTWPEVELRRALTGTLRRIRRRLTQDGIAHRPLGTEALLGAVTDLAHRSDTPVREGWPGVHAGGLRQVSLRVARLPALPPDGAGQLVDRLLTLPTVATTVSVTASSAGTEVVVRVATPAAATSGAVQAARKLLGAAGLSAVGLDGRQLAGLAATLPLGLVGDPGPPGALADRPVELPPAGVVLGRNRRGHPVVLRLLRPEPTRALLVGGVRAAQLITLRALALGAHVAVQTSQPGAWEPFLRAVSLPSDAVVLVPAGQRFRLAEAGAFTPQLVVTDAGPAPDEGPWRTTLVVRDRLDDGDADLLGRADLVLLQPLSPAEAALAGATLGLGEAQEWLARIGSDLVAVVNRRAVRFARLAATPWELQLVGNPERVTVP